MSEYQYYEFITIDHSLSREQMRELRERSTRAKITSTSFINSYEWGGLKADPMVWMQRYFDALVYTANWCTCELKLRLPRDLIAESALQRYAAGDALQFNVAGDSLIVSWLLSESENHERFNIETGGGWMGRLAALRNELLRGDRRALYLGWLAGVSAGMVDDHALEPELPPGLASLTTAQQALIGFLEIDPEWIAAAAVPRQDDYACDFDAIESWVAGLSRKERDPLIALLVQGEPQLAERRARALYHAWCVDNGACDDDAAPRTVADLRALVEQERRPLKTSERSRRKAEDDKRLRQLAADFDAQWHAIEACVQKGTAAGYDTASAAIAELAAAYALVSNRAAFDAALGRFMQRHGKRRALAQRLAAAGLWNG
ncbi:hypothetical protein [Noviherbaspirillum pedocola]|uniref:Uncharacterized protein n=1 Tax=Noviherbaspirillum pedocola TaxID=2801341 RepID=A0A934W770_9BURK|nr:hypothetical protein [Noviherbaspirillum pedocola]MBK4737067.1 hypothetical protein [Noviherbaspirillum pedocola]